MKAKIKEAKIRHVDEIWKKHKPQGLGFSDTDVIIVNLKLKGSKTFSQSFYCRIKGDGTLGHSITKASEKRQRYLQNFIREYISKKKDYNVRENIKSWKGKTVEVEEADGDFVIKL